MDYIQEYSSLGVEVSPLSSDKDRVMAKCTIHDDTSPSLSIDVSKGLYKCFNPSCPAHGGGNFEQYVKLHVAAHPIPEDVIAAFQHNLQHSVVARDYLSRKRGLTEDTIQKFRLGVREKDWRITIPIFNEDGKCVNVRQHLYAPRKEPKTISWAKHYGIARLFPLDSLAADTLLLMEGELDCILANQLGYAAITSTNGSGTWRSEFSPRFKGKTVYIIYDTDSAGHEGARKAAKSLLAYTSKVYIVTLPIDTPANADFTDYIVGHKKTRDDVDALLQTAEAVVPAVPVGSETESLGEAKKITLASSALAENVGKAVAFRAVVSGKDTQPYLCPKTVQFTCPMGKKTMCPHCSIAHNDGSLVYDIQAPSTDIIRLVGVTEDQQKGLIRKSAGIHPECNRFTMNVTRVQSVEDVRLIPEIELDNTNTYVDRQGFIVGSNIQANATYDFTGVVVPNPKNQYLTIIAHEALPYVGTLDCFALSDADKDSLKIFQPQNQTVQEKFHDITRDLSHNVTHIYQRDNIIVGLDLIYHSVLGFSFQNLRLPRGWVEGLFLGDTRCGKTETAQSLQTHYKAAELITGENCSYAGIVGGMSKSASGRMHITWGKLPLNDGRMIILDEASGLDIEHIAAMSDVRSKGIATITKIQTESTLARVRAAWFANSRSGRRMDTYSSGVEAVQELIGRTEDIARFDFCMGIMSSDVPVDVVNSAEQVSVPHKYTSELCHKLVMWAWTRKPNEVHFTDKAVKACLAYSIQLGSEYSSEIPLVESSEMRVKLARLAAAAAARMYSTEDGVNLLVQEEHVDFVHSYLQTLYRSKAMDYYDWSRVRLDAKILRHVDVLDTVLDTWGLDHSLVDVIDAVLDLGAIRQRDLEDILNIEKSEARTILNKLFHGKAVKKKRDYYVKTPAFIDYLKDKRNHSAVPPQTAKDF